MSRVVAWRVALGALLAIGSALSAQTGVTTWSGVFSAAQAAAGEGIFLDRCAGCHQPDLSGGEDAPALAGAQFSAKWHGHSLAELSALLRRSMPQDAPGSLTADESSALIAHVLQRNGFPEGTRALPSTQDQLADIAYIAQER